MAARPLVLFLLTLAVVVPPAASAQQPEGERAALFRERPDNILLLKVSYWLGL